MSKMKLCHYNCNCCYWLILPLCQRSAGCSPKMVIKVVSEIDYYAAIPVREAPRERFAGPTNFSLFGAFLSCASSVRRPSVFRGERSARTIAVSDGRIGG